MAIIDTTIPLNMLNGFDFLRPGGTYSFDLSQFRVDYIDGTYEVFTSYSLDFSYDSYDYYYDPETGIEYGMPNSLPIGGTVNSIQRFDHDGNQLLAVSDISIPVIDIVSASTADFAIQTALDSGDDSITGSDYADVLVGFNGDDYLSGGAGDDSLIGGAGNDSLDGGTGADQMSGGLGDDNYYIDDAGDTVFEAADEGNDGIYTSVSFALAAGQSIEWLSATASSDLAPINLSGNELDQQITGNDGANVLDGGGGDDYVSGRAGNDTLIGGAGNDSLNGDAGNDNIDGGTGDDYLSGGAGSDTLIGGAGSDQVDGGTGADQMSGGLGDDNYNIDNAGDAVFEAADQGNDGISTSVSFALAAGQSIEWLSATASSDLAPINLSGNELDQQIIGNDGANVLDGGGGDDSLGGGAGNDTLIGGAGSDQMDGGTGADRMSGGLGDDAYYIDNAGDAVFEAADQGYDGISTSVSFALAAGQSIERLSANSFFSRFAPINLTGNELDQSISGNDGANVLDGGGGDDSLSGGAGNDTLIGGAGNDSLSGDAGNDILQGGAGNDDLFGGTGADQMSGGLGDDNYYIDNAADAVFESAGGGEDRVVASVNFALAAGQSIEWLYADTRFAPINIAGNELAQEIYGNDGVNAISGGGGNDLISGGGGNDNVNGGAGADEMIGGFGNDSFIVDNSADQVFEYGGQGTDSVLTSVSFTLGAYQYIEVLSTISQTGVGAINLTGNELAQQINGNNGANIIDGGGGNDVIYGFDGNDYLNGGTGADQMYGGLGNDVFIFDNAADRVFEAVGQGTDSVLTSVSFALAAGQHVEVLSTTSQTGVGAINLTGNEIGQQINGNKGVNTINGGGGNDVIYGGAGKDTLAGGAGYDHFVFNTALNASTNVDRITDFNVVQDTIRLENAVMPGLGSHLGTLYAANFWKSTTGLAHDSNDRIIYETDTGWLNYDSNGSAAGGAVHIAQLNPNLALTYADFLVI